MALVIASKYILLDGVGGNDSPLKEEKLVPFAYLKIITCNSAFQLRILLIKSFIWEDLLHVLESC